MQEDNLGFVINKRDIINILFDCLRGREFSFRVLFLLTFDAFGIVNSQHGAGSEIFSVSSCLRTLIGK